MSILPVVSSHNTLWSAYTGNVTTRDSEAKSLGSASVHCAAKPDQQMPKKKKRVVDSARSGKRPCRICGKLGHAGRGQGCGNPLCGASKQQHGAARSGGRAAGAPVVAPIDMTGVPPRIAIDCVKDLAITLCLMRFGSLHRFLSTHREGGSFRAM